MTPLLISLLQISIIMSIVAVGLHLVMDRLSNSIPPKWKYYIWGIVLLSFLIPFRPKVSEPMVTVDAPVGGTQAPATGSGEATAHTAISDSTFLSQIDISTLILIIWITGMAIFLAVAFIKHMRFMNTAKRWGTKVDDTHTVQIVQEITEEMNISGNVAVIKSKMVSVPMMAGIFKPILFLPSYELDSEELKYVIRHEMIHYRKFDILVKLLSILANAVHWFNPLVYIMQRWIHTDCEVACDYEATKTYEEDERIRYVETIIGVAKHEIKYKTVFSTNFYDGKNTMKKRLESVFAANKMRGALAVILVASVGITCVAAGSALAVNTVSEVAPTSNVNGSVDNVTANDSSDAKITDDKTTGNKSTPSGIDSNSGSKSTEPDKANKPDSSKKDKGIISKSKAKSIALDKVGGGHITECELDTDDGIKKYEIKIIYNGHEYDIEINAGSGTIISFEKELPDDDDDDDDD